MKVNKNNKSHTIKCLKEPDNEEKELVAIFIRLIDSQIF